MSKLRLVIAISALSMSLAACGHSRAAPAAPASNRGGTASPAVTLVSLTNGDRACYVAFKGADGQDQSQEGAFELCEGGPRDATALIGKQVTFTTKQANVQAASCEGNSDCQASDSVELIVTITVAP